MLEVQLAEYVESLERIFSQYTNQELKCTYDGFQTEKMDDLYTHYFQLNFWPVEELQEGEMLFPSYSFPVVVNADKFLTCEEIKQLSISAQDINSLFQDCWWTSPIFRLLVSYLLEYEESLDCTTMTLEMYYQYEQAVIKAANGSHSVECDCDPIVGNSHGYSKILN